MPDLATLELFPWDDRSAGNNNIIFQLGDGVMHAHMSEIGRAAYKKAHRHPAGFLVLTLTDNGYLLLWEDDGRDFTRIEWKHGVVFPPCNQRFHQHFVTSNEASRYIATGMGGMRYPFTELDRDVMLAEDDVKIGITRSYKEGDDQIEYEDQDPRVHAMWLEELKRKNITPRFELPKVRV